MSQQLLASNVGIYDFNGVVVEIPLFQLLQWKHAISLEMKGLTHSRGSVTAHVRRKLSCPDSYKRADLYKHLSDSIDSITEQLEGGEA